MTIPGGVTKQKVCDLESVYTANAFLLGNDAYIAGGSELHHPSILVNLETGAQASIADVPGGVMSILPVPSHPNLLISVMGLFPPFVGEHGGVFLHQLDAGAWSTRKIVDLPFAHRAEIISHLGGLHLLVASVAKNKDHPGDWSKAGEVYHFVLTNPEQQEWTPTLLSDDLVKNHGMGAWTVDGRNSVCVSGENGIYAFSLNADRTWEKTRLFDKAVSEFAFYDLDEDGVDELVTIEPFHGDSMNIYRRKNGAWVHHYDAELAFGHGLSAGRFRGRAVAAVGNRRGSMGLEVHAVIDPGRLEMEKIVVENDVAPTQIKLFTHRSVQYILSANQLQNEIILYS